MSDNEIRAHDLAIASVIIASRQENIESNTSENGNFDIAHFYKDAYESALRFFNREFPDEKE